LYNGLPHGLGVYYRANGDRYAGKFNNNQPQGTLMYYCANDGKLYQVQSNQLELTQNSVTESNSNNITNPNYHSVNTNLNKRENPLKNHNEGRKKGGGFSVAQSQIIINHSASTNNSKVAPKFLIDENSTNDYITKITQDSIRENNGKLRIAINTEGMDDKRFDEDWIKNKVDQIMSIVKENKSKASALTVNAIDIELYNSGGDAYVAKNQQSASAIFLKIANKAGVPFTMTYVQNDGNRFRICNQGDQTPGTNPFSPEASKFMTSQQPSTFMTRF
jgi:hypothetical protein